jgi:hypothetical protein
LYGQSYTSVVVGNNGLLQFNGNSIAFDTANSTDKLVNNTVIAPLWESLSTGGSGDDIFIDSTVANQITIRWNATNTVDSSDVNFSATLFSDGRIRFDYGAGNTNLTPTVGISSGNGQAYQLLSYDGAATLTNANSLSATLIPGVADIGAFEFLGSSSDVTPPTIVSSTPPQIHSSGTPAGPITSITLTFSEPLNRIDAAALANYELRGAGPDNTLDTGDDVIYTLSPSYVDGSTQVTLDVVGTPLISGLARLSVFTNAITSNGPHDRSGVLLDGDANGTPGGNYVRTFRIGLDTSAPQLLDKSFSYNTETPRLLLHFSKDISADLSEADLQLTNTTTGQPVPTGNVHIDWIGATNPATVMVPGFAGGIIDDGVYHLVIPAASVKDLSGNPLTQDGVLDFFYLLGDANHDGAVNALDFNLLATNFGASSGGTFALGDFNYDGRVNSGDFNALAINFNKHLTLPAPPIEAPAPSDSVGFSSPEPPDSLFRDGQPIESDGLADVIA